MNRETIDSSNVHSIGHDETGLEVQFHRTGCARTVKPPKGETIQAGCNCEGGAVYHYPGFPPEGHAALMAAPSAGSHFMKFVRPKWQGVKVEPKAAQS